MPDKRYKCGTGCLRCWENRLKHGCPQAQAYLKKHPKSVPYEIVGKKEESYDWSQSAIKREEETIDEIRRELAKVDMRIDQLHDSMELELKPKQYAYKRLDKLLKQQSIFNSYLEDHTKLQKYILSRGDVQDKYFYQKGQLISV